MGPTRSRAMNSHLARASRTCEEKYKNLGSGLVEKGCSLKPKYLMIASVFIVEHSLDSMPIISAICQVGDRVEGNFARVEESCWLVERWFDSLAVSPLH